jgi:hypothetical protein
MDSRTMIIVGLVVGTLIVAVVVAVVDDHAAPEMHVKMRDGFTIAVSEAKHVSRIAKRTVLSTNALAVVGPILEETVGWERARIRQFFESYGILIQEWDSVRTDWLTLRPTVKVPVKETPATVAAGAASSKSTRVRFWISPSSSRGPPTQSACTRRRQARRWLLRLPLGSRRQFPRRLLCPGFLSSPLQRPALI